MKPAETTEDSRKAGDDAATVETTSGEQSWRDPIEVLPMIRKAVEKHRLEWRELMKKYPYQFAAYRGDERLEIGKTKHKLYRKYLDRGLSLNELVVLGIGPDEDDLDGV